MKLAKALTRGAIGNVYAAWVNIASRFGSARYAPVLHVAMAYKRLFKRPQEASQEDVQMVLMDLAIESGVFRTTVPGPDVDSNTIWFESGKRYMYERMLHAIELSPEQLVALRQNAEAERAIIENGGH